MRLSRYTNNLKQAFKIALSLALFYWLALSLGWALPMYGALAIALISLDTTGASLHKGLMRIVGTSIGLGIGLFGLALFAQDPWLMLVFLCCYLTVVSYFLQASRYPYAWFVAGFITPLIWATTYGKIDNAFDYATFRYLETTAGVVISTVVNSLLWPRHAGDSLDQDGSEFSRQLQELFVSYRRQLSTGDLPADAPAKRTRLNGAVEKFSATLEAAYLDTQRVAVKRKSWESVRVAMRNAIDSLEQWRQSIEGCCRLMLNRRIPGLEANIDRLEERIARINNLWRDRSAPEGKSHRPDQDPLLLDPESLDLSGVLTDDLSHLDRATVLSFTQQLSQFDQASCDLLRAMRVANEPSTASSFGLHRSPLDLQGAFRWDPSRIVAGLLAPLCFIGGWIFWVFFDPPTGPSIPAQAATFGLLVVMNPVNLLKTMPYIVTSILGVIAPVYFLVMPRLSSGPQLLAFVFLFAFVVSSCFAGRFALLRTVLLATFVTMTNITNAQVYSFSSMVDGVIMIVLGIGIVAIAQAIVTPLKPEAVFLRNVRRFFDGCIRVISSYAPSGSADGNSQRRRRKQWIESMVLQSVVAAQTVAKKIDRSHDPIVTPQQLDHLVEAMQGVANRLKAVEYAHQQLAVQSANLPGEWTILTSRVRTHLNSVAEQCANFQGRQDCRDQQRELDELSTDLERQFDRLEQQQSHGVLEDPLLTSLYTAIGAARGLVDAMGAANIAIGEIRWDSLATPRF